MEISTVSGRDVRVLVVEDEFLVSEMIQGLLEEVGYTCVGRAANGAEAVELVASLKPDVVLMDVEMSGMDGIETTWHIQESNPTPVVVLTAHESRELVARASAVGVGSYLVKPPSAREIERAVTIAVARFNDMMKLRSLNAELEERNRELQEALERVRVLSGLLPICSNCKKIRDDEGYWHQLEIYIRDHSDATFSHGLCPDCARKLYPDLYEE